MTTWEKHLTKEEQLGMERALRASGKPPTPPKIEELIERLREVAGGTYHTLLLREAADALKQMQSGEAYWRERHHQRNLEVIELQATIAAKDAELRGMAQTLVDNVKEDKAIIAAKDAEIARLREALEKIADWDEYGNALKIAEAALQHQE
jgi:hypothetical protein